MLWIGIDAATEKTGIVAVRHDGVIALDRLICVSAKREKDSLKRSEIIMRRFRDIILQNGMDFSGGVIVAIGIEKPIYVQNPATTIKLSILWGMLYVTAKRCTDLVYEIPVAEGKYALTENRKATKQQMIDAVKLQFSYTMDEHCADATGIALATRAKYLEEDLWNRASLGGN